MRGRVACGRRPIMRRVVLSRLAALADVGIARADARIGAATFAYEE
ncbi:hypothetical protein BMAPRL20_1665 [Burkholderia mallei PRL-20]|uniref:Uncharacterized protein n=3 Tax=pseudomallei group TaxID=111527 RepID=A2S1H9_BURM9|nr:hypothetical protein BMA10229_2002 [Burkholderia mallei NCTC 10229]ABN94575.1 hypothetical protein BURPS1106A_A2150 [Burkholderia pseudomallei 1106a]EDK55730.1 hypothetical protein BMAFMH_E0856 [Burkholderia mallei FMH]EDK61657.1 hypothetical protein BMAJHU_I0775 [Burkholderia mallei JHU]EDK86278.1 hypothetical protein BMA721280_I0531 [Burkholderia mallei 2002721280]EDP87144.1 hypothetical protein BMA10399_B2081 [Burkholderia mallei ATCC 10399]EEH25498.1 conserved hypothetical protein [Bur